MAAGVNAVVLVGNLTKDPELRVTQGGTSVCGMRLAVNGREKIGEQWHDRADYFDIRVWGKRGESCAEHLHRGSPVAVSGRLRLEEWTKDEVKHNRVLIVADSVQFLERRGDGGGHQSAAWVPDEEFAVPTADFGTGAGEGNIDADIPFLWREHRGEVEWERGCSYRQAAKLHVW